MFCEEGPHSAANASEPLFPKLYIEVLSYATMRWSSSETAAITNLEQLQWIVIVPTPKVRVKIFLNITFYY